MARRHVVEIVCDRCNKVETQSKEELPNSTSEKKDEAEIKIRFHGQSHSFGDLCRRCRKTVSNYVNRILRKDEEEAKKPDSSAQVRRVG